MKYYLLTLCIVFGFGFGLTQAKAETITNFSADYVINSDGTVLVEEVITYDFEGASRHGIFRTLQTDHAQPSAAWYKTRDVKIELTAVEKDGAAVPFTQSETSSQTEIKIGDPNTMVSGVHEYTLTYTLVGALSYGPSGAEFYWNVTGSDWPVTILQATAVVRGPLQGGVTCYTGSVGQTENCSASSETPGEALFAADTIYSGQDFTIAAGLDSAAVATLISEGISYVPFGLTLATVWIIFVLVWVYRKRVEYKIDRPVIAQYEPYENYLPMYTGVLYDGRLDPRDITAGLIYLAEQGFIKIKRTEKKVLLIINTTDYEIELLRPVAEIPTEFLKTLSGLLFNAADVPPKIFLLSSLTQNSQKNSQLLLKLKADITTDLRTSGFKKRIFPDWSKAMRLFLVLFFVFSLLFVIATHSAIVLSVMVLTIVILALTLGDRFTTKGYEAKNHLDGFKLFLSVTDAERFDFHNAPEKSPELFMKYLPYAVAFGIEEKWSKVFAGITIPQPDWYDGGSVHAFSATALTHELGSFSKSFTANSGSGTSGSSGGGSSGGGGGGGGGGSW